MKAPNPFNPLNWVRTTQDFFLKSERSSGFRPFLIFFVIVCTLVFSLLVLFKEDPLIAEVAKNILYIAVVSFILLFAIKAFQDPNFCRSEKHVETVRKLEMSEKKGDGGPRPIDISTTQVISNPNAKQLAEKTQGGFS